MKSSHYKFITKKNCGSAQSTGDNSDENNYIITTQPSIKKFNFGLIKKLIMS